MNAVAFFSIFGVAESEYGISFVLYWIVSECPAAIRILSMYPFSQNIAVYCMLVSQNPRYIDIMFGCDESGGPHCEYQCGEVKNAI